MALTSALAKMYVQRVSMRRVSKIVEELCGCEVSSGDVSRATELLDEEFQQWRSQRIGEIKFLIVDARYEKLRENGCIVECAAFVAIGVDADDSPSRATIGLSLVVLTISPRQRAPSRPANGWPRFLKLGGEAAQGDGWRAKPRPCFGSCRLRRSRFD